VRLNCFSVYPTCRATAKSEAQIEDSQHGLKFYRAPKVIHTHTHTHTWCDMCRWEDWFWRLHTREQKYIFFLAFFFFFSVLIGLGFELKALHLQKRHSSLSHTSSPFCSGYFGDEFSKTICPGCPQIAIFPFPDSQVAKIMRVNHWHLDPTLDFLVLYFVQHPWTDK
jgi:hypothetical protein